MEVTDSLYGELKPRPFLFPSWTLLIKHLSVSD